MMPENNVVKIRIFFGDGTVVEDSFIGMRYGSSMYDYYVYFYFCCT